MRLSGPCIEPASGGSPRQLIVLLHGFGADGDDLIRHGAALRDALPEAEFIAPHAPFPNQRDGLGREWFDLRDQRPERLRHELSIKARVVDQFLTEALAARGLDDSALALIGFSQGCMLALHLAMSRFVACAAVVGIGGRLIPVADEVRAQRAHPPVMLIHGDADLQVPVSDFYEAQSRLRELEVWVEGHCLPDIAHVIEEQGLALTAAFLRRHFSPTMPLAAAAAGSVDTAPR